MEATKNFSYLRFYRPKTGSWATFTIWFHQGETVEGTVESMRNQGWNFLGHNPLSFATGARPKIKRTPKRKPSE